MRRFVSLLAWFLRDAHTSRSDLVLENLALRQQLATYARTQKRPRLSNVDRGLRVLLSRRWSSWSDALIIVKPATVVRWYRVGFRRYWTRRSRPEVDGVFGRHTSPMLRTALDAVRFNCTVSDRSWRRIRGISGRRAVMVSSAT